MLIGWCAGALFLAEGFYLPGSSIALPFGSVSDPAAGAVSAVAGLTVLFLSSFYRSYGFYRPYLGTLLVLISAGDLWFGGGFWVGSFLGATAGALIIALPPYPRYYRPEWPGSTP